MFNNNELQQLINQMNLEEKINMLHGDGLFQTKGVKRLGIPPLKMSDGPMGVRQEFPNSSWTAKGDHHDFVTYFPSNTALAATWNPDLAYDFGKALGDESRSRGKDIILAPGINIIRSPFCGRTFEYMSEDPYLTKKMATPVIKGIQEKDVAACVKHYIANNQETKRLEVDVKMDDRTLEEIYLPAFEETLTVGDSYSLMAAYNKFNGEYCCESQYLLTDLLKTRFNYDGVVISDWGACHSSVASAKAGLDIEMAVSSDFNQYYFANPLYNAVMAGEVNESVIDEKILRILQLMNKINMLDSTTRNPGVRNTFNHQQGTLAIAKESIVLLKNKNNVLPLDPSSFKSIVIIGENGDKKHSNGGGSAEIKALYEHTPYAGIDMYLGGNHKVQYVKGYTSQPDATSDTLFNLRQEALRIASQSDIVIFVGGLNHDHDTEGLDRTSYELPYEQDQLIKELHDVVDHLITVNISGSSVDLNTAFLYSDALIHSWYNGMEGGSALAHILFGTANPCGKLPFTMAKTIEDYAAHSIGEFPGGEEVHYLESIFVGYRHFDSQNLSPLFPFGYGLSYSSFEYNNLDVQQSLDSISISFTLKNQGLYDGKEVCQFYISQSKSDEPRPLKELKGFVKPFLKQKESKQITYVINKKDLGYYNEQSKKWIVESGEYQLLVASSSLDIRLSNTFRL